MTQASLSATFILFTTTVILASLGVIGYVSERRQWNKGVSKKLGTPWVLADKDSTGGRLYVAEYHGSTDWVWISYPVDSARWKDTCGLYYILAFSVLVLGIVACLTMSSCTTRILPDAEPGEVSRPIIESRF